MTNDAAADSSMKGRRVRNDIEGLRALAVLAVLINHSIPRALPGGFAGVDIFFVISGYLIGRHLLQDIEAHRFSFLGFYAKRARRIFPALALVLVSVWCVGWVLLSAPEFSALGRHIAAASAFSNNILLWSESGYFDVAALEKPLLHLWSLGIEEQFYLLVPALLWLASKGSKGSVHWVALLGAASLLATIILSNFDFTTSFYLLHTRFWELAAGVVLAQVELRSFGAAQHAQSVPLAAKRYIHETLAFAVLLGFSALLVLGASDQQWARTTLVKDGGLVLAIVLAAGFGFIADRCAQPAAWNLLRARLAPHAERLATLASILGTILIVFAIAAIGPANWPGAQTLFPVLGAVLLIAAAPAAAFNKLFALRPLAFIGGISYPLYLWHWPAITYFRLLRPEARGMEIAIPLIASFVLAWGTKTFLEDPVRFGRLGRTLFRAPPLWMVSTGLGVAAFLGLWAVTSAGLPWRFPPRLRAIAEWSEENPDAQWRVGRCYYYLSNTERFADECTPIRRTGTPLLLLWGDSHAAHLYPGLASAQASNSFDIAQWTSAGCPPTVRPLTGESASCAVRRATALGNIEHLGPDGILLGGAWERYLDSGQSQVQILSVLSDTVDRLKSDGIKRIVIFGPGPVWNTSLAVDLFRFMAANRLNEIPPRLGKVPDAVWRLDTAMASLAASKNVQYVSILDHFCRTEGCQTVGDRSLVRPDLIYRDRDHLTVTGSRILIATSISQLLGSN
jgi:peptidoglycan/LPS O-acetylase OafA/YrhL